MLDPEAVYLVAGPSGGTSPEREEGGSPHDTQDAPDSGNPPIHLRLTEDVLAALTSSAEGTSSIELSKDRAVSAELIARSLWPPAWLTIGPSAHSQTLHIAESVFVLPCSSDRQTPYEIWRCSRDPEAEAHGNAELVGPALKYFSNSSGSTLDDAGAKLRERRQEDSQRKRGHQPVIVDDAAANSNSKKRKLNGAGTGPGAKSPPVPFNIHKAQKLAPGRLLSPRPATVTPRILSVANAPGRSASPLLTSTTPASISANPAPSVERQQLRTSSPPAAENSSQEQPPPTPKADPSPSRSPEASTSSAPAHMPSTERRIIQLLVFGPLQRRKLVQKLSAESIARGQPPVPEPVILRALHRIAHAPESLQTSRARTKPTAYTGPVNRRTTHPGAGAGAGAVSGAGAVYCLLPEVMAKKVLVDWPGWDTATRRSAAFYIEESMEKDGPARGTSEWRAVQNHIWGNSPPDEDERKERIWTLQKLALARKDEESDLSELESEQSEDSSPEDAHADASSEETMQRDTSAQGRQSRATTVEADAQPREVPTKKELAPDGALMRTRSGTPSQRDRLLRASKGKGPSPSKRKEQEELERRRRERARGEDSSTAEASERQTRTRKSSGASESREERRKRLLARAEYSDTDEDGDAPVRSKRLSPSQDVRESSSSRAANGTTAVVSNPRFERLTDKFHKHHAEFLKNSLELQRIRSALARRKKALLLALQEAKNQPSAEEVAVTVEQLDEDEEEQAKITRLVSRQSTLAGILEGIRNQLDKTKEESR